MLTLADAGLLRTHALIDGCWIDADDDSRFAVHNPVDGTLIATVPRLREIETQRAIDAAVGALAAWSSRSAKDRGQILRTWFGLLVQHADDLARLLTLEQGKPLAEAKAEVAFGAAFIDWFAEEGKRAYGDVIPSPNTSQRLMAIKQPVGVCAAITPWNFPIAMITRKVAPALAAGCTIVVKPAQQTPLSALAVAELAMRAGIPAGVLNVVTADAESSILVGKRLCESPDVRKLSFTGSTSVGRILMSQCASTVKKLSLELGGHAPFIVFDDADLDAAVEGAMASKYRNAGQTCVCTNRIYVHDQIYAPFVDKLAVAVSSLKLGSGLDPLVQQGPLIDAAAVAKVEAQIADAMFRGARLVAGGRRSSLGACFYEPTVLAEVTHDMIIAREETFGPVAPVFRFHSDEEVLSMANATEYGLAAYFYTRDVGRVWRMAERLEYGMVGVNTGSMSNEVSPFGGIKQSGVGREGSRHGLDEYLELKYICMGSISE